MKEYSQFVEHPKFSRNFLKKESDDIFQSILSDARKIKASFDPRRSSYNPYPVVAVSNAKKFDRNLKPSYFNDVKPSFVTRKEPMHQEYHQQMPMSSVLPEPPIKKMETAANVEQCSVIIYPDPAAVKHIDILSAIPNPIASIQLEATSKKSIATSPMTSIRVDSSFATDNKILMPSGNQAYDRDSDAYGDYNNDNASFVGPAEEPVINNFFWLYRSFPHLY